MKLLLKDNEFGGEIKLNNVPQPLNKEEHVLTKSPITTGKKDFECQKSNARRRLLKYFMEKKDQI